MIISDIISFFRRSCRPPANQSPSQWVSQNVRIMDGLTPYYDVDNAPWFRTPLDELANGDTRECVMLMPVGMGKSTFLEAGICYIIAEDPGPTMIVGQTDDLLREWAETRLDYAMQNTESVASLLPKDKTKKKKLSVILSHMVVWMTGAKISGLQEKSMRRVFCDEAWKYAKGRLNEARARLHGRWNRQFWVMSQAGEEKDDLSESWNKTDRRRYGYHCPKCGLAQPFEWENVKWDEIQLEKGGIDKVSSAKTARIRCKSDECGHETPDAAQPRRALCDRDVYLPTGKGLPHRTGFTAEKICNWRIPLWELVLQYLECVDARESGDQEPLKQFHQKELARPWKESEMDNRKELLGGGYTYADYTEGQRWEGEFARIMTLDVQGDHFWCVIRAWRDSANKGSRQVYASRVVSWHDVDDLIARYQVKSTLVAVDAGYNTDAIYQKCAEKNWTALHGSSIDHYEYIDRQTGKKYDRPYSLFKKSGNRTSNARYAHWSNTRIKDTLFALRNGATSQPWELPDDVPENYLKQIDAEHKVDGRWKPIARGGANHFWDCEAMQVAMASMLGLVASSD